MSLPLVLAPLVFQFLPKHKLREFPEDDPLLIAVLQIQKGCRPFKVIYAYSGKVPYRRVTNMGYDLRGAFSTEALASLGVVHRVEFQTPSNTFTSLFCQNDFYPFPRAEELSIRFMTDSRVNLSMFPKLRKLELYAHGKGVTITPRSRTMQLNYMVLPGGRSIVDGVLKIPREVHKSVTIEMNKDRCQGSMKQTNACVVWDPCFDKSWCRSMELRGISNLVDSLATLKGFSNLTSLTFFQVSIHLSPKWLPNLPLEKLMFRVCDIRGTEFGSFPFVKELGLVGCKMAPLQSHLPQLESLFYFNQKFVIFRDEEVNHKVPIAKEDLRKVKYFALTTYARQFDLSSFEELRKLELSGSWRLERLNGLNVDTLEQVRIDGCRELEVDFPCHVKISDGLPDIWSLFLDFL